MSDDKREMTDEELLKSVREQVEEEYRMLLVLITISEKQMKKYLNW